MPQYRESDDAAADPSPALLAPVALILYEAIVIAEVIFNAAALFLREAVERAKDPDLLQLAAALAIMIAALVLFLSPREIEKPLRFFSACLPTPTLGELTRT